MTTRTHDLGRFFIQRLPKLDPGAPLFHVAPGYEWEPPYRESETRVLRLWPTNWAVAWGWWYDTGGLSEDEHDRWVCGEWD